MGLGIWEDVGFGRDLGLRLRRQGVESLDFSVIAIDSILLPHRPLKSPGRQSESSSTLSISMF